MQQSTTELLGKEGEQLKKITKAMLLSVLSIFLVAGSAMATFIDFRVAPFDSSANDATSYSKTVNGLTIHFTPLGITNTIPKLYWDSDDGFGVKCGGGYEKDEVEYPEKLRIDFSSTVRVSNFYLTDLFFEKGYYEIGRYSLDNSTWYQFQQTDENMLPSPASNGLYTLAINSNVSSIWFDAPGNTIFGQDHEFSVAGVDVAPEPTTMLLLGTGLIGLACLGRKKLKESNIVK